MSSEDRRQTPRFAVSVPASVTSRAGESFACEIVDVGDASCQIRLAEAGRLGDPVILSANGEQTLARVIWTRGDRAGLWLPNAAEPAPAAESFLRRLWRRLFEGRR